MPDLARRRADGAIDRSTTRDTPTEPMASIQAAVLFGTPVAETILASVHVRAHRQAGHMNASDPIEALHNALRGGGRPHTIQDSLAIRPRSSGRWSRPRVARPPPPAHRRAWAHGVAESIRLHETSSGRGGDRALEAGDRGRAARAHRRASRDRGGGGRPHAQPHVGLGRPNYVRIV